MGKAHSGKTSMRSIIFANYLARDTTRLSPTLDVEHHHVRFLGDLVLNLWDCGGQDAFYESYFERDRESIFRSVELLIYVFDIESDSPEKDFDHFAGVLEAIEENSPDARIFVLVHKMDLVAEEDRDIILEDRKRLIEDSCTACGVQNFECFGTSIWDETLYKAWSEIVTNLIPNIGLLKTHLNNFCRICDADEVVLFERATFLVISHAQSFKEETTEQLASAFSSRSRRDGDDAAAIRATMPITAAADATDSGGGAENEDTGVSLSLESSPKQQGGNSMHDSMSVSESGGDLLFPEDNSVQQQQQKQQYHPPPSSQAQIQTPKTTPTTALATRSAPGPHFDAHRFEKISNIVKQFKLSCGKAQSQFQGMEVCNSRFSAFIDAFTVNTYIMVIVSDPNVHTAATLLNIKNARPHFERLIPRV